MSRRRALEMMAGIRDSPIERMAKRMLMRQQRLNAQRHRELQLVDMINRRQAGESGLRPMPFAPPETNK